MTTVSVITLMLNISLMALTPIERWRAASGRFSGSFVTQTWFIVTATAAVGTLTALLVMVSLHRMRQHRSLSNQLFDEYAERIGLSERERQLLLDVADKAALKQKEAIFTMADAFQRGAAVMIQESLTLHPQEPNIEQFKCELSTLREKLGFQKQPPTSIGTATKRGKLSSRQIPVGKKLHVTRRKTRDLANIESTVIKNNDIELILKLARPLEGSPGEFWRARYYFGASVWEFDTSAVCSHGDILVLNHSDNVRFINRRRFLRVPVNKQAFVAMFPFKKEVQKDGDLGKGPGRQEPTGPSTGWRPPQFIPAVVTELAGPGLRIEAPLKTEVGDRILVTFQLDEDMDRNSPAGGRSRNTTGSKIIEDIGVVRHTMAIDNGFSIAVELTGLNDFDLNELIRATNAAALKARAVDKAMPADAASGQDTKTDLLEAATH